MSLSEKVLQLNGQIGATVERAIAELRQDISQRLRAGSEEIQRRLDELTPSLPASFLAHEDFAHSERELGTNARRGAQRDLRDGIAAIDRARSQAEILTALLAESARQASRAAVLLIRGGEVRGWGSEGFGEAGEAIRSLTLTPQDDAWGRLIQGQGTVRLTAGDCAELCSRVESPLPHDGVLVPLVLRDRVAAALYADRAGEGELAAEALQILAYVAAQAIETLPFRERASTPTLALEGQEPADVDTTQSLAAPESAPAAAGPEPEVEIEPEVEAEPEPQSATGAPWTEEEEQSAEAEEAPSRQPDSRIDPRYTEELSAGAIAAASVAAAAPEESSMEEPAPRYPRPVEPEPTAPVRIPDPSPDATVLLPRSALQQAVEPEPTAPAPFRPVAVPEEPAAAPAGTPEVRPPSGVDGPGWAFATTRVPVSPSDETMHEEARRLARLLVSEIKLYNEEQVEEGRRNRDVYERLKEDIDRSRQMYDERVDPKILRSTDYFYQELVRILAAGDSRALGI